MSTFPTNLPDPNQGAASWITQYQGSRAQTSARGFDDFFNQVLREHGEDPANWQMPTGPGAAGIWHQQNESYRQQAQNLLEAQNRQNTGGFFNPKVGVSAEQGNFLQDLFLGYDLPRIQGAADRQFARNNEAIAGFRTAFTEGAGDIRSTGEATAGGLRELAGTIGEPAMGQALGAVESAQEGVRQAGVYGDRATQAAIAGVQKNLQLALAGNNPDGSPMTAEQRAATTQRVLYDSQVATGAIRAQYDAQTLQMQGAVTQAHEAAAGTATNVAQLSAGLMSQAAAIQNSATLAAAQLMANGSQQAAALIMANPESVVSVSNGILNLWGVFLGGTPAPRPEQNILGQVLPIFGALAGGVIGGPAGAAAGGAAGSGFGSLFGHGGSA